ncbi:MAG: DNA adenine methylase [Thermodesulfobacteriota bacterium]|nr:DNA adenine methylase [Thermodesulfobacteriota bacterium]
MIKKAKPFLKWAGGKTQLLNDIDAKFPYKRDAGFSYIEPFVGSGAVLFWVLNNFPNLKRVVINDINEDLINSYKTIKTNISELIFVLENLEKEYHFLSEMPEEKKEYYYAKRKLFNTRKSDGITQTAIFIFLNRTCFNGLYRVNKKNEYNVPIGSYKKPMICDRNNLLAVNRLLQKVDILNEDFEQTVNFAGGNSIFYFDPPYKPLSDTSSFNSYAKDEFDDDEQIRLKEFCDKLDLKNTKWILSNSDVKGKNPNDNFFEELFEKYQINRVMAKRSINANPDKRGNLTELLILNQGAYNAV